VRRFDFDLDDIAKLVGDLLAEQKKEIVRHLERRVTLVETKLGGSSEEVRAVNLHRRLCAVESALRTLTRNRGNR
jgi:chaperonin cofactor prefoldin